jgi:osmotically-inducible protein OsmY
MDERILFLTRTPASPRTGGEMGPPDAGLPLAGAPLLDDDVLAEAIRTELRSDVSTAALPIEVEVWDRVVHLRGVVATSREQHAAERVAARVHGVGLVANDLELR